MRVEADGPVPCDLAIVGEAPGKMEVKEGRGFCGPSGKVLWGGHNLIGEFVGRPRETCYVTNVCKEEMPEHEWEKLTYAERQVHITELRGELLKVQPKIVLAFGRRASQVLVPGFTTMTGDAGKAVWNRDMNCIVMALWHPAAMLRGNTKVLPSLVSSLSEVPAMLEDYGAIKAVAISDQPQFPEAISFLKMVKLRDKTTCILCGKKTKVGYYEGDGLKWRLCMPHAITTERWARDNEESLRDHARIEFLKSREDKVYRAAERMQKNFTKKIEEREHYS
jgi:DNA polymerase